MGPGAATSARRALTRNRLTWTLGPMLERIRSVPGEIGGEFLREVSTTCRRCWPMAMDLVGRSWPSLGATSADFGAMSADARDQLVSLRLRRPIARMLPKPCVRRASGKLPLATRASSDVAPKSSN